MAVGGAQSLIRSRLQALLSAHSVAGVPPPDVVGLDRLVLPPHPPLSPPVVRSALAGYIKVGAGVGRISASETSRPEIKREKRREEGVGGLRSEFRRSKEQRCPSVGK